MIDIKLNAAQNTLEEVEVMVAEQQTRLASALAGLKLSLKQTKRELWQTIRLLARVRAARQCLKGLVG